MKKILLFLYYVFTTFVAIISLTSFVWLPMFLLPNLSGFIIGLIVTFVTIILLIFD